MNFPKMRTETRTGNSGVPNAVEHIWYGHFCRQYTVGLHSRCISSNKPSSEE